MKIVQSSEVNPSLQCKRAVCKCAVCRCAPFAVYSHCIMLQVFSVQCASVHYLVFLVEVCITCGSVQVCITCGSVQVCIKVFSGQFYCYRESLCHSRDPPPTAPPALLLKILYGETHWKIFCFDIVKYSNGVHKNIRNMKSLSCLALLPFVSYCVQRNTVDLCTSCL